MNGAARRTPGVRAAAVLLAAAAALGLALLLRWAGPRDAVHRLRIAREYRRARDAGWKISEVLDDIEKIAGPTRPLRIALLGNHPMFNQIQFDFARELRGDRGVEVFSPKEDLGDFTDFILLKTGDRGPTYTLGYAAEAAALVENPPEWFSMTFAKRAEWPLPDGSRAVLYVCDPKPVPLPPFGEVEMNLKEFPLPGFSASGVRVRLTPASPEAARRGDFARIVIECDRLNYNGFALRGVRVDARDVSVNLPRLFADKELHFLRVGEIRPSATVPLDALNEPLARNVGWLREPSIRGGNGRLEVAGRVGGLPVWAAAAVSLSPDRAEVCAELEELKIGPVPLPAGLVSKRCAELSGSAGAPYAVRVAEISISTESLKVKGEE